MPSYSVQRTSGATVRLPALFLGLGSLPSPNYSSLPALPPAWRKVCGRGISPLHTAVLPNGNCTRLTELSGRCLIAYSLRTASPLSLHNSRHFVPFRASPARILHSFQQPPFRTCDHGIFGFTARHHSSVTSYTDTASFSFLLSVSRNVWSFQ